MKYINKRNMLPYSIIAILCLVIFAKPFGSGDELWNYNFARNIANGLIPYKDFNIVQTPLSAYIPAGFMVILGDSLIIHRIVGYFLLSTTIMTCYHLCKKITKSGFVGFISAIFVFCICLPYYIYNYNYLSALVILFILEIESNNDKQDKSFIIGFLVGVLPLIKQNTGFLLIFANSVVALVNVLVYKKRIKMQAARIVASIIPSLIFVAYMWIAGAIDDFWDYAILGIRTFTHRTTMIDLILDAPVYAIFIAIVIFAYIVIILAIRKEGISSYQLSGLSLGTAWMMITYPLFDAFHLVCVYIVLAPVFLMFVKEKKYRLSEKVTCITVVMIISFMSVLAFLPIKEDYVLSTLNNYEYVLMPQKVDENIRIVDDYIKEKIKLGYNVRITDDSAVAYKIPLELYEKNWDMLLVGNVGSYTVDELLYSSGRCLYLVYKYTDDLGSQDHFDVINHIKDNYVKIEEVLFFDVYEKRE